MKCGMCKYFEKDKRYCFGYCQKMNGKNVENYDNCHCNGFIHKYNELDIRKCIRDCRCKVCDKNVKNEDVVYIKSFRLNAQPYHICLDCWAKINDLVCSYKNESMLTAQKSQNSNNNEIFNARSKDANIIKPNPNKKIRSSADKT